MLTSLVWALATHRDANPFGDAHVQPAPPPPPPATVGGCNVVDTVNAKLGFTLDLTEYTRASWFPQLQQINSYQPADQLFCLSATYDLSVGLFGPYVTVSNKATGPDLIDTPNDPFPLCARLANGLLRSDKLSVAPCFLPSFLGGPYWVAHLEMDEAGHYTAAAVVGGQPTVKTEDGLCTTPERASSFNGNGEGLWILTREKVAPVSLVAKVKDALVAKGISTSQLKVVQQEGCAYAGRTLKP
jgi:hypothetical protein